MGRVRSTPLAHSLTWTLACPYLVQYPWTNRPRAKAKHGRVRATHASLCQKTQRRDHMGRSNVSPQPHIFPNNLLLLNNLTSPSRPHHGSCFNHRSPPLYHAPDHLPTPNIQDDSPPFCFHTRVPPALMWPLSSRAVTLDSASVSR